MAHPLSSSHHLLKHQDNQKQVNTTGPRHLRTWFHKYYYGTAEEKAECYEVIEDFSSMLKMYVLTSGEYEISEAQKARKQNVTSVVQEYFSVNYTQIPGLLRMVPTIHFIG